MTISIQRIYHLSVLCFFFFFFAVFCLARPLRFRQGAQTDKRLRLWCLCAALRTTLAESPYPKNHWCEYELVFCSSHSLLCKFSAKWFDGDTAATFKRTEILETIHQLSGLPAKRKRKDEEVPITKKQSIEPEWSNKGLFLFFHDFSYLLNSF